jgi:hypothetical protein
MNMRGARQTLTVIWFAGAACLFVVLLIQSFSGHYGDKIQDAWGWYLPSVMPTLSLMATTWFSDADSTGANAVDPFTYRGAMVLSIAYLLVLMATIFASPFTTMTDVQLMQLSHLWLAPIQSLVMLALGYFFSKRPNVTKPDGG